MSVVPKFITPESASFNHQLILVSGNYALFLRFNWVDDP